MARHKKNDMYKLRNTYIGLKIKRYRVEFGFTISDFAKEMNLTERHMRKVEAGGVLNLSIHFLMQVCSVLCTRNSVTLENICGFTTWTQNRYIKECMKEENYQMEKKYRALKGN